MNTAIIAVILGTIVILGFVFVVPRGVVDYDPRPGIRAQVIVDLDPNANDLSINAGGITVDKDGMLYVSDNSGRILRINPENPRPEVVGTVPGNGTSPQDLRALAFDRDQNLYIAGGESGQIWKLDVDKISTTMPGTAALFASGLNYTDGMAFDRFGRLLVTNPIRGYVWEVDTTTRVNNIYASGLVSRESDSPIGVNGIAVARSGHVFVSNTANGVIHIIETRKESGYVEAVLIWRSDPRLIGADGMQFDAAGNLWIAVSARNAIVAITPDKEIIEVSINGNTGPLEFPAGLAFSGDALYVINSDSAVGENKQRGPGIGPSISKLGVGVIGQRIPP